LDLLHLQKAFGFYNITRTLGNDYTKFLADANVARVQYLDSCPAHDTLDSSDMLLDSSNIAEECFICSSEVSKKLISTTHSDKTAIAITAENVEL